MPLKTMSWLRFWCAVLIASTGNSIVRGTLMNVALNKPAVQIDDYHSWGATRAVNGELEQAVDDYAACTCTRSDEETWWLVDLVHHYTVQTIRIQNRQVFNYRLKDFYIYVSSQYPVPMLDKKRPEDGGELCLHHPEIVPIDGLNMQEIHCDTPIKGRYVYIWKAANSHLSICEFEVWVDVGNFTTAVSNNDYSSQRYSATPIYSEILTSVSPEVCFMTCITSPPDTEAASHFQINKVTGVCECVKYSDIKITEIDTTPDVNWDLWSMNVEWN